MATDDSNGRAVNNRVASYMENEFRIIPIRADGSKAPAVPAWKPFQDPDHEQCDQDLFDQCGIGVLCGACSGNLEVIDFDEPGLLRQYMQAAEKIHPGLVKRCVIISTPSGGNHLWYRCEEPVEGNQKLAMRVDPQLEVRIETRGEGGYVLGPGSPNECHETGNLYRVTRAGARISDIPLLSAEERSNLLLIAKTFDLRQHKEDHHEYEDKGRPGDEFNREADWEPILEPYGWKKTGTSGAITYWRRPDKKTGVSATTGFVSKSGLDLFCVFTTSCPEFDGPDGTNSCSIHTKFDTFCRLHHKGSHKAGAADLADKGFGTKLESTITHWYTYADLMTMDWEVDYIVKDVLAAEHVCIMFGPSKTLKTSIACDLTISLAMGLPFLGKFDIERPVTTAIMSGESGKATMKNTFMRIAKSKGLSAVDNFLFSPTLPRLSVEKKLENLEKDIIEHGIECLILDPAYLCMNVGERESSLFAVGAVLNPFIEMCAAREVTPIILHHTKQSKRPGAASTLGDLSWAGFEQIARQWIALNRKTEYETGTGVHELIINLGGSMGHSSNLEVTIDEGTDHDKWEVKTEVPDHKRGDEIFNYLKAQKEGKTVNQIVRGIKNPHINIAVAKKMLEKLDDQNRISIKEITHNGKKKDIYSAITHSVSKRNADKEN